MNKIDEKILNFCGIYQKPEITEKKMKKIFKQKKELEELTGMRIEKIYVFGEKYWGKNTDIDRAAVCFLVDERIQRLNEVEYEVKEYTALKNENSILFWSLCQFQKRSLSTAEWDYYIANYGLLVYDTGKDIDIDERVGTTVYAASMDFLRKYRRYYYRNQDDCLMHLLMKIYIEKIGYYVEQEGCTINLLIEYINYISNNEEIKQLLNKYKEEVNESAKLKMCDLFEKLISSTKQVLPTFKLDLEPTMKVYERKLEEFKKHGTLDINTLTIEDEYIMYVIEGKSSTKIARIYGVDSSKITQKNNYWNIRVREEIITYENIKDIFSKLNHNNAFILYQTQQKSGLLNFERCLDPILKFMKSGEKYLLKEFWRFTEFEKNNMEEVLTSKNSKNWYKATLAMDF